MATKKKKKGGKMKYAFATMCVLMIMFAVVPAFAGDGIQAEALIGTYFHASTNSAEGTKNLNISQDASDWYGKVTVGYGYGNFTPFASYEEKNEVFTESQVGVDYAITDNVGLRGAYVSTDTEGVSTVNQGFVGVKLKYN